MKTQLLLELLPVPATLVAGCLVGATCEPVAQDSKPVETVESNLAATDAARPAWQPAPRPTAAGPSAEGPSHLLLDDLDRLFASGRVQGALADDPDALRTFLLERYLELDDHDAAWELLATEAAQPAAWQRLATSLEQTGDDPRALQALGLALDGYLGQRLDANVGQVWAKRQNVERCLEQIRALDPAAAVDALEALSLEAPGFACDLSIDRLGLLLEAGRTEQAFDRWQAELEDRYRRPDAIDAILAAGPALAEGFLGRQLALVGSDPELEAALATCQARQGCPERALGLIDRVLPSGDPSALELLSEALLDLPDQVLALRLEGWLDSRAGLTLERIDSHLIDRAIGFHAEHGCEAEALELFLRVLDALARDQVEPGPLPSLPPHLARAHAERLAPALRAAEAGAGADDELWGDFGDLYWDAGLAAEAHRCWTRAAELEPSDWEWPGKLRAVQAGLEPR